MTKVRFNFLTIFFQAAYSTDILYAAILSSSKASTALFYRTITLRSSLWMSYALLTVTLVCAPITILLLAVRCNHHPWHDISNQCSVLVSLSKNPTRRAPAHRYQHQFPHWQAVTALDIIFEITLLLYPVKAILRLQTTLHKRIIVILVLSSRLLYVRCLLLAV